MALRLGLSYLLFSCLGVATPFVVHAEECSVVRPTDGNRLLLPVIKMHLRVGQLSRHVEVSLMDRRAFPYAMLLGQNFIGDDLLVDNR